ncbi:hypothetical protein [Bacillus sp. C1]
MPLKEHCNHCNVILVTFNQTTGEVIAISPSIGTTPPPCATIGIFIENIIACLLRNGYKIDAFYQSNFTTTGVPTEETFVSSKC